MVLTGRGDDAQADRQYRPHFAAHGLGSDRVSFVGRRSPAEYMRWYHEVDVLLDTSPYSGVTTTCDALWMGVPVVTDEGERYSARMGGSILAHFRASMEGAAETAGYFDAALGGAKDIDRLARFRDGTGRRRHVAMHGCDQTIDLFGNACRAAWENWAGGQ
jgi:predicted O-linked N-acetylglucosamine transferase (SPINDLY family)